VCAECWSSCATWEVQRHLIDSRKQDHHSVSSELLTWFEHEGNNFLDHIMTEDEIWMHSFEPEKEASVEWHLANFNRKKKIEAASSAGTAMTTVFWDMNFFMPKEPSSTQKHMWRYSCTFTPCSVPAHFPAARHSVDQGGRNQN